jgi:hypothetical protein
MALSTTKVWQDTYGSMGNCTWACIATIFPQFSLDDLRYPPPYDHNIADWTNENLPGLHYHSRDLCTNYRMVDEDRWTYDYPMKPWEPPVPGLWMATIPSPGVRLPESDPYYPGPGLHAVVFDGDALFHDPNPRYVDYWKKMDVWKIPPRVFRLNWWSDEPGPTSQDYEN